MLVHNSGGYDPEDFPGLYEQAVAARDELGRSVGAKKAMVIFGWNTETGQIAAGLPDACGCPEDSVVAQLGVDPSEVMFTAPVRPKLLSVWRPLCSSCQTKYFPWQFPKGG